MAFRLVPGTGALVVLAGIASAGEKDEQFALGREVFLERAEPACAVCHVLEEADAAGAIGPSLDSLAPSEDRVRSAVERGIGAMPAYDELDDEEIDALAHYVAAATGGAEE